MLAKRIIPCLDITRSGVVKGVGFRNTSAAGDPVELAKSYDEQGADEIVILDIGASVENRKILVETVKKVAGQVFIPLTVGGGMRTLWDFGRILRAGADKVSVNTAAVRNPDIIRKASQRFGSQSVVVAIDAKKAGKNWEVFIKGGRIPTGIEAICWAKKCETLGAGEILLTSIDRDGTKSGYDLGLTKKISESVNIPVIASGGCGSLKDLADVFIKGKADAALAASIFHYSEYSVGQVKEYLAKRAIKVRK